MMGSGEFPMRFFLLLCLLAWSSLGPAQTVRESVALSTGWRFQMDMAEIGEKEAWFRPGFDHSGWSQVPVPRAWDTYDEGLWGFEGIGWYAASISGSQSRPERVQRLRFGRVMYHSKVWLNGESLGEHIGGYLPFEFDVTGKLRPGEPNLLVLRVDNRPRLEWPPGAKQIEWMQFGGILEPVTLETRGRIYLSDVTVRAVPRGSGAAAECLIEITSAETAEQTVSLRVAVDGVPQAVQETSVQAPPGVSSHRFALAWDRARRWSPHTPNRYTLRAALPGRDETTVRFGVREIAIRGRQILLNGEPLWVQGVNRYDEYARYGPNAPRELVVEDLRRMKAAGVNFVRVHYPQSPELIGLYDELGFLMMEEVPLNWWGNGFSSADGEVMKEDILEFAMPMLEGMIRRDKNHPSVAFWSMANESQTQTEVGIAVMRKLLRRARELDPTRPATFVIATKEAAEHKAFADADLVAVNIYLGGRQKRPALRVADTEDVIGRGAEEYLRRQLAAYPDKPLLVTEFGTPGVRGIHGDVQYTEEFQAAALEAVWGAIRRCPEVSGGVLWSWADYYHRRNFIVYAAFGPYGVVAVDRREKAALAALARMFGGQAVKVKPNAAQRSLAGAGRPNPAPRRANQ